MAFARRMFKGNAALTSLAGPLTNIATSFTVAAGGGSSYPNGGSGNFYVVIDRGLSTEEKILCSSRSTDTFTVAGSGRGVDDTSAQAHGSGAAVEHCITAVDTDEANNWVSQLSAATTAKGDEAIATAANTLGRLAIGADNTVRVADSTQSTGQKWALVVAANITNATITDVQVAVANKDGVAGTASMRTLGTGAAQACAGNDSRLSDSRAPTGTAGGDLTGTYPNPTIGAGKVTEATLASDVFKTGDYKWSAQTATHGNWLKCDGTAVSRSGANTALFALIGTAFGTGNGTTTFNLPDPRGRSLVSVGAGTGLTSRTLGQSGGEETHILITSEMPVHTHVQNAHTHTNIHSVDTKLVSGTIAASGGLTIAAGGVQQGADVAMDTATATNQNAGGDGAHNNMHPWLAVGSLFVHT